MRHHRIVRRELIYKQQAGKDTERYSVDELGEQKLNARKTNRKKGSNKKKTGEMVLYIQY